MHAFRVFEKKIAKKNYGFVTEDAGYITKGRYNKIYNIKT